VIHKIANRRNAERNGKIKSSEGIHAQLILKLQNKDSQQN
jgi:hypothetical protein